MPILDTQDIEHRIRARLNTFFSFATACEKLKANTASPAELDKAREELNDVFEQGLPQDPSQLNETLTEFSASVKVRITDYLDLIKCLRYKDSETGIMTCFIFLIGRQVNATTKILSDYLSNAPATVHQRKLRERFGVIFADLEFFQMLHNVLLPHVSSHYSILSNCIEYDMARITINPRPLFKKIDETHKRYEKLTKNKSPLTQKVKEQMQTDERSDRLNDLLIRTEQVHELGVADIERAFNIAKTRTLLEGATVNDEKNLTAEEIQWLEEFLQKVKQPNSTVEDFEMILSHYNLVRKLLSIIKQDKEIKSKLDFTADDLLPDIDKLCAHINLVEIKIAYCNEFESRMKKERQEQEAVNASKILTQKIIQAISHLIIALSEHKQAFNKMKRKVSVPSSLIDPLDHLFKELQACEREYVELTQQATSLTKLQTIEHAFNKATNTYKQKLENLSVRKETLQAEYVALQEKEATLRANRLAAEEEANAAKREAEYISFKEKQTQVIAIRNAAVEADRQARLKNNATLFASTSAAALSEDDKNIKGINEEMLAELKQINKNGIQFLIAVKNGDLDISYDAAYHFFHSTLKTEFNEFGGSHVQISRGKLVADMQVDRGGHLEAVHTEVTTGISRPHGSRYLSRANVKRLDKFINDLGISDDLLYQIMLEKNQAVHCAVSNP